MSGTSDYEQKESRPQRANLLRAEKLDHRRHRLRYCSRICKYPAAAGALLRSNCWKSRIFNYLLHFNCTNHWSVFGKKMRMEHLDWHWTGTDRSLSALYERLFLSAVAGSASPAVCPWIFLSYLVLWIIFPHLWMASSFPVSSFW